MDGLNNRHLFPTALEAGSSRSRCQQKWFLMNPHSWLAKGHILAVPSHGGENERERETEWALFYLPLLIRTPILSGSNPALTTLSKPNHLNPPPPNTITLRVRVSTYEFGGDKNIQCITTWLKEWHKSSLPICPFQGKQFTSVCINLFSAVNYSNLPCPPKKDRFWRAHNLHVYGG